MKVYKIVGLNTVARDWDDNPIRMNDGTGEKDATRGVAIRAAANTAVVGSVEDADDFMEGMRVFVKALKDGKDEVVLSSGQYRQIEEAVNQAIRGRKLFPAAVEVIGKNCFVEEKAVEPQVSTNKEGAKPKK